MSRVQQNQEQGNLVPNPTSRYLSFKNFYTKEEVVIKGKTKEVKVFEKCGFEWSEKVENGSEVEWVRHTVDLPLEFALINGDWVNFNGWNETEKIKYFSNEVNSPKDTISVQNKEGIVYEFTLNQLWGKIEGSKVKDEAMANETKGKLKALGVKQHSSLYVGLKNENGEFELVNIQLKGANLSGVRNSEEPSGWWNVSRALKKSNKIYTHYLQLNDWVVEDGELGEYGVLNFTLGDKIDEEDGEKLEVLYEDLKAYHDYYLDKKAKKEVPTPVNDELAEY